MKEEINEEKVLSLIRSVISNPKRYFTKEEFNRLNNKYNDTKIEGDSTPIGIREIPNYYTGEILGIRAKDVISDFNLSYNVGTAVTYLLRAGNKPDNSYQQDLEKACHHLQFELERIKNKEKK